MNAVIDAIKTRRCIRSFKDTPVPDDLVQQIIDAGCWAPSGVNMQPWKFLVITNKEVIKELSDLFKGYVVPVLETSGNKQLKNFIPTLKDEKYDLFYGAPCVITVFGRRDVLTVDWDCAMAAQNMMLTAHSLGLGSCWIGFATLGLMQAMANKESLVEELRLPAGYKPVAPLIFGYPAHEPQAPPRERADIFNWIR